MVTRERIRQIEAKALRKLRHRLRGRNLRAFVEADRNTRMPGDVTWRPACGDAMEGGSYASIATVSLLHRLALLTQISVTDPARGASTGISIFMDSSTITDRPRPPNLRPWRRSGTRHP